MITQWLVNAFGTVIDWLLTPLSGLIPEFVWDQVEDFADAASFLFSAGPISAIFGMVVFSWALDLFFASITFTVQAYRLVPFKAA